ncbi:MAG TPA: copper resistance protein CopC [Castellaniella sp.]|uniref:copper resistance CopC family protein n=1 Tax=Castellaniella sp. TaxID=1955812 RepID=UPI002F18E9A2
MKIVSTLRSLESFLCLSAAAGVIFLGSAGQALAHAHPVHESPAPNAIVTAPSEVRISYDDPIEPALSHLTVQNAQGKQVNQAKSSVEGKAHKTMRVALPALAAGQYQVQWVAVADDGHRTHGSYKFTVK